MATLTWKQEKAAAKADGRRCFGSSSPCENQAYMNNRELADLWLEGWEEARFDAVQIVNLV